MTTNPGATQYAVQLDEPREIKISGAVSGEAAFDGSEDIAINVKLKVQPAIGDLTDVPTQADFNKLLAVLRAIGAVKSGS